MKYFLYLLMLLSFGAQCNEKSSGECVADFVEGCFCAEVYQPVCGCNGVTYSNACDANCHSISDYTEGECGEKNN